MSKAGDIFENPVTGEFGYIRIGTEETDGKLVVADLRVRPNGEVMGEHMHSNMKEKFIILEGAIGYKLGDKTGVAKAGDSFVVPPNVFHDWWNAGEGEAHVIVEFHPGLRFEQMITTFFGLAQEGKTNDKGIPNLLQLAVINQEFSDVIQLKNPPAWVQKALFGVLGTIGRLMGYKATYPRYENRVVETVEVEPLPDWVEIGV